MADIILHHYDLLPFSEKIRRILAYKDLPWRSVEQPIMMPKPDLQALTGGYRRIPVLQIGADVYCDTACMARRIEELHPARPVIPAAQAGLIAIVEDWADHRLFMQAVPPTLVGLLPNLPAGFIDDRVRMSPAFSQEAVLAAAPQALGQLKLSLDRLEAQLTGRDFLLGADFTLADAACHHVVWFTRNNPAVYAEVTARPALAAWVARIDGFGPGRPEPLSAADALAIARAATPAHRDGDPSLSAGESKVGDEVGITADDYGPEATAGRITAIAADRITIERDDAALGAVAVHFPRAGYRVVRR